jgi:hypothetical protein
LARILISALGSRGPLARSIVAEAVRELERRAERTPAGATWATTPAMVPWRRGAPARTYDLGLAHGVPGVLAGLAGAVAATIELDRAKPLLEDGVRWLLAQRREGAISAFAVTADDEPGAPNRLAWCYGDAGVAVALEWIGRVTDRPDWRRVGIELGLHAATRDADTFVVDAGLCHGAAGLLHAYNRLGQATDEPRFAECARRWFDRTRQFALPPAGVRGLNGVHAPDAPPARFEGLLEGGTGVALALVAASGTSEPAWDRALALSSPAAAG